MNREQYSTLALLHEQLSTDLDRIRNRFRGPAQITLIVRMEDDPEANEGMVLTTEDDMEKAFDTARRLKEVRTAIMYDSRDSKGAVN